MFWEKKLESWIKRMRQLVELPLRLELWNGRRVDFSQADPQVTIRIASRSAVRYLLQPSLANLGTAYVEGKIDVLGNPDRIISIGHALARHGMRRAHRLLMLPSLLPSLLLSALRHSRPADAEAIRYHYDVSNAFYQLWLDRNMVYSCAYFEQGDENLETAQLAKIDHILKKIRLQSGQRLLDIGCGWGALVLRAAERHGARCVGITLSTQQHALAQERIARAGLSDRVEVHLQDYRDVRGEFDRITSVGMFEHVGLEHLPAYFRTIHALLKEDGVAMNHGITTTDVRQRETPFGAGEFIGKYVFPDGALPHLSTVLRTMQEAGLETLDVENLRRHYARTCELWTDNFEARSSAILRTTDERHFRIWRMYLAGCAYAFAHDQIALHQVVCIKAGRDSAAHPWSRRYMYPAYPAYPTYPACPTYPAVIDGLTHPSDGMVAGTA